MNKIINKPKEIKGKKQVKKLLEASPFCAECGGTGLVEILNLDDSYKSVCQCVIDYIQKNGVIHRDDDVTEDDIIQGGINHGGIHII